MDSCVGREREDQAVKRLFSRKDFLANIMKGTIAEYADLSIEEIMDCIEGDTIQTGTALVSEDAANTIRGENPLPTRKKRIYQTIKENVIASRPVLITLSSLHFFIVEKNIFSYLLFWRLYFQQTLHPTDVRLSFLICLR